MTKNEYRAKLRRLMQARPMVRGIAYDDDWWPEPPLMSGSAHAVSGDRPDAPPSILVPDGHGDYREHTVTKTKRRMGF